MVTIDSRIHFSRVLPHRVVLVVLRHLICADRYHSAVSCFVHVEFIDLGRPELRTDQILAQGALGFLLIEPLLQARSVEIVGVVHLEEVFFH